MFNHLKSIEGQVEELTILEHAIEKRDKQNFIVRTFNNLVNPLPKKETKFKEVSADRKFRETSCKECWFFEDDSKGQRCIINKTPVYDVNLMAMGCRDYSFNKNK